MLYRRGIELVDQSRELGVLCTCLVFTTPGHHHHHLQQQQWPQQPQRKRLHSKYSTPVLITSIVIHSTTVPSLLQPVNDFQDERRASDRLPTHRISKISLSYKPSSLSPQKRRCRMIKRESTAHGKQSKHGIKHAGPSQHYHYHDHTLMSRCRRYWI